MLLQCRFLGVTFGGGIWIIDQLLILGWSCAEDQSRCKDNSRISVLVDLTDQNTGDYNAQNLQTQKQGLS